MQMEEVQRFRRARLEAAAEKAGGKAALGRLLGYRDGALVGQMLRSERPVTEATVAKLEAKPGFRGWFSQAEAQEPPAPYLVSDIGSHPGEKQLLENLRILHPKDRDRLVAEIHALADEMREYERLVLERVASRNERAISDIRHSPKNGGGVTFTEGSTGKPPAAKKHKRK